MGKPKQLLPWGETTLLGNCVSLAQAITNKVVIVTGAYREKIEAEVKRFKLETVFNPNWDEGLGNSIATGVNYLVKNHQEINGILILLPDQPLVTTKHLKAMIGQFSNYRDSIIATAYNVKDHGVPVLFHQKHFEALKTLTMDTGAKTILKRNADQVISLPPEFDLKDIDTQADYEAILNNKPTPQ